MHGYHHHAAQKGAVHLMRKVNGLNIQLTQGDTLVLRANLAEADLPEGSEALFTVKRRPNDETPLIEKRIGIQENAALIQLASADTALPPRTYCWDLRVLIPQADGACYVHTPMTYAKFEILEVIGHV